MCVCQMPHRPQTTGIVHSELCRAPLSVCISLTRSFVKPKKRRKEERASSHFYTDFTMSITRCSREIAVPSMNGNWTLLHAHTNHRAVLPLGIPLLAAAHRRGLPHVTVAARVAVIVEALLLYHRRGDHRRQMLDTGQNETIVGAERALYQGTVHRLHRHRGGTRHPSGRRRRVTTARGRASSSAQAAGRRLAVHRLIATRKTRCLHQTSAASTPLS